MTGTPGGGTHARCPRCGVPVMRTPDGVDLEPQVHPLAIHKPDGTDLTAADARAQLAGRAPPAGHHLHRCPPRRHRPSNPDQLTLI